MQAIRAFAELYKKDQNIHFVFANTGGAYTTTIHGLFKKFLPNNSYTEIKFENDIQALYYVFNFYVHTPIYDSVEAFGQTYIEALASGVPSIFTLSGVANEFIINERNAMVVSYQNSIDVYEKLIRLLGDISLRNQLVKNGRDDVEKFALDPYTKKMINFYNAVLR